jgi:hypothetical protein
MKNQEKLYANPARTSVSRISARFARRGTVGVAMVEICAVTGRDYLMIA